MRLFVSFRSSTSVFPFALSSVNSIISRRSVGILAIASPAMNFRGAHSAPIQSTRNAAAAADPALHGARFHSLSDEETVRRDRDLQQLGGGIGIGGGGGDGGGNLGLDGGRGERISRWDLESGDGGGNLGLSSGRGERNSRWNLEQQQEQGTSWRGEGENRSRERVQWRKIESNEREDAAASGTSDPAGRFGGGGRGGGGGQWWGGRGRGGGGVGGRISSRGRAGGGVGRGDWRYRDKSNDWEERPRNGDFKRDGGFNRSRHDEERHWCYAESEPPAAPHEKFVLISYNILADKNAFEHYNELYYHIPYRLMNWDRRRGKLVEELGYWSPDIMCLQEVDKYEELQEAFQRMGYRGAYKGRTGGARDGCAMFWKTTRFELLEERSIQFNELGLRDNVAQLCVFQSIAGTSDQNPDSEIQAPNSGSKGGPGSLIIVGNIHVLFNPKRGDVKLGQVRVLLESAHALSEKYGGAPVTIGGDFNSTPKSDLYKFIATSELDISCLNRTTMSGQVESGDGSPPMAWMSQVAQDWSRISRGAESQSASVRRWHWTPEELLAATGTSDCTALRHNLNLRSAYSQIKGEVGCRDEKGEPLVTTFHRKFMGTVDYIWHTEGIDTVKVLDTVPVNVLQRSRGLPSQKWGSDHLALVCELAFLPGYEPDES